MWAKAPTNFEPTADSGRGKGYQGITTNAKQKLNTAQSGLRELIAKPLCPYYRALMLTPLRLPFRRRAGRPCPWLCVHKDARSRRRGLIPANHKTGGHCACKIQRCGRPRQRSVGDKKCPALRAEKLVWFALSSHRITKVPSHRVA